MKKRNKWILGAAVAGIVLTGGVFATKGQADAEHDILSLRQVVDGMNGTVAWSPQDSDVVIDVGGEKAQFRINSVSATINGKHVTLDQKPTADQGNIYVSRKTALLLNERLTKKDAVTYTFSTVGDDRTDPAQTGLSAQDTKWLVNSKVVTRMSSEMQDQKAKMLFFNGDMIMGYTPNSDVNVLNREYAFWRGIMAPMYEKGIYVFPVPGNHEVQDKYKDASGQTVKKATQANENTWRDNMGDVILDEQRFQGILGAKASWDPANYPKAGTNNITTDQKQLSYSFDYQDAHFAVINTDPAGNDSHAPAEWLAQDLEAAKKRGMKHLFVFGHKMAYTYKYDPTVTEGGLDVDPAAAAAFWKVIEDHKATYFAGHEHIFHVSQPNQGQAYQVIVGSGGSPFEATQPTGNPTDRMYAWATVKVFKSGKVHIDAYGFDENYDPTQVIQSWDLNKGF